MLPDAPALALFIAASLVLLLTPGPAVFYIVTRSAHQGLAAGMVSVLGVHAGTLVHIFAAAVGISAVIASSAIAFGMLKYAGAAYLIYLGVRTWRDRGAKPEVPVPTEPASLGRLFVQGAVVNILNPKTALFFLAFLPQFVDPARGHAALQLASLGVVLVLLGVASDGAYALAAGSIGRWLRGRRGASRLGQRLSAGVYVGLGVTAALADPPAR